MTGPRRDSPENADRDTAMLDSAAGQADDAMHLRDRLLDRERDEAEEGEAVDGHQRVHTRRMANLMNEVPGRMIDALGVPPRHEAEQRGDDDDDEDTGMGQRWSPPNG